MRFLLTFCLLIALLESHAQNHEAEIKTMFAALEQQGIDTADRLPYQYYFKDGDSTKLVRLSLELFSKDYAYLGIEQGNDLKYTLTVEKEETHTVASLVQREKDLLLLTKRFGVQVFDGFEVSTPETETSLFERLKAKVAQTDSAKLFNWGKKLMGDLMYREANVVFERCLNLKIKADSSYFYQGYAFREADQIEKAINCWEAALNMNPKFWGAALNMGHSYRKIGKKDAAIVAYKKAVEINPNNDKGQYALAYILAEEGDATNALIHCEKALEVNPKNVYAQELLKNLK